MTPQVVLHRFEAIYKGAADVRRLLLESLAILNFASD